jgi:putative two-component system response regulator
MTKILIVDDDDNLRQLLVRYLGQHGYPCIGADRVEKALDILKQDKDITIILSDVKMPGKTGIDLLSSVRAEKGREFQFIVMTAYAAVDQAIEALRLGAQEFLQKPFDLKDLRHVIDTAKEAIARRHAQSQSKRSLEAEVSAKSQEIRDLLGELDTAHEKAIRHLAVAAEYKDPETGNHIKRIGQYAWLFAAELGWAEDARQQLELAASLHDIGKIGTPDRVLLKPGKLSMEEFEVMKQHCEIGSQILSGSHDPVMKCAAIIARGHHECWDGSGYPSGLVGEENPMEARITTLCDVYDALRSPRPYKPSFSHDRAVEIILEGDGRTRSSHFDPELLAIFRAKAHSFDEIYSRFADTAVDEFDNLDPVVDLKAWKNAATSNGKDQAQVIGE